MSDRGVCVCVCGCGHVAAARHGGGQRWFYKSEVRQRTTENAVPAVVVMCGVFRCCTWQGCAAARIVLAIRY